MIDYEKVMSRLDEISGELEKLKSSNYTEGRKKEGELYNEINMFIRRIYPNYKEVERKLFSVGGVVASNSPELHQRDFLRDIDRLITAVNTIKREFETFGFDDFTPVKEKVETEYKVGSDKIGFYRKKTTK